MIKGILKLLKKPQEITIVNIINNQGDKKISLHWPKSQKQMNMVIFQYFHLLKFLKGMIRLKREYLLKSQISRVQIEIYHHPTLAIPPILEVEHQLAGIKIQVVYKNLKVLEKIKVQIKNQLIIELLMPLLQVREDIKPEEKIASHLIEKIVKLFN